MNEMEKKMKKLLVLLLALSVAFAMSACGDEVIDENMGDEAIGEESVESTMTISEFIAENQDDFVAKFDNEPGTTFAMVEEEGSLIFTYIFTEEITDIENVTAQLEATIDANESVYSTVLELLRFNIPDAESFIVAYYNPNGDVLAVREFS